MCKNTDANNFFASVFLLSFTRNRNCVHHHTSNAHKPAVAAGQQHQIRILPCTIQRKQIHDPCRILVVLFAEHFSIHAEDEAVVNKFSAVIPASRVLVNTPSALGGIGATTCLFPALTLGCGTVGGSASSNNIGPWDLINIKRMAWGVREKEELFSTESATPSSSMDDRKLEELVRQMIHSLMK